MKRFFPLLSLLLTLLCLLLSGCAKSEAAPSQPSPPQSSEESSTVESVAESSTEGVPAASAPPPQNTEEQSQPNPSPENTAEDTMYILIGDQTLTVEMADNSSAQALLELLEDGDITVNAHDYGNFEKVGPLGTELPTNDEQISTQPGDVILYQGDQITLYYDSNSWSFTRLGRVQGVSAEELKAILGDGDVTLVLSLKN